MENYRTIAFVILYCIMIAVTHGYVYERNGCFQDGSGYLDQCGAEPVFKATFWPAYWVYHSGTLFFEPKNLDR